MVRHDYLPFGEGDRGWSWDTVRTAGMGMDTVRQKYTGYERDGETGLDYAGARYFDSKPGRFTSTDPTPVTQENFVNPQRWNLYIYVNNNPLSSSDSDGADGQGQGGDKIISVFLAIQVNDRNRVHRTVNGVSTEELEAGPLWQDTKKLS
ncbi:MAG: RHS repeat-associated core domain-containing protein [Blastocatellales bacterium]|nr:RHS repeat-associated core domain-containing protein [Blastocatellales bacterium]